MGGVCWGLAQPSMVVIVRQVASLAGCLALSNSTWELTEEWQPHCEPPLMKGDGSEREAVQQP